MGNRWGWYGNPVHIIIGKQIGFHVATSWDHNFLSSARYFCSLLLALINYFRIDIVYHLLVTCASTTQFIISRECSSNSCCFRWIRRWKNNCFSIDPPQNFAFKGCLKLFGELIKSSAVYETTRNYCQLLLCTTSAMSFFAAFVSSQLRQPQFTQSSANWLLFYSRNSPERMMFEVFHRDRRYPFIIY